MSDIGIPFFILLGLETDLLFSEWVKSSETNSSEQASARYEF